MTDQHTFAQRLRERRGALGMSVAGLAERAGLHRQVIYKLEEGDRDPAWSTVQALAKALGVRTDYFRAPVMAGAKTKAKGE